MSPNRFRMFGIPVLVYAIICAACLYSNWSSILSAVLSIVSIVFISTCMVPYEKNIGADRVGHDHWSCVVETDYTDPILYSCVHDVGCP